MFMQNTLTRAATQDRSGAGRPWTRMIADASQRRFDTVLVCDLSGVVRSMLDFQRLLGTLDSYGIRLIITSLGASLDLWNRAGKLLLDLVTATAQFERNRIGKKTRKGGRAARAKGKTLGRPRRMFRRDEVCRLRTKEHLSWRAISKLLGIPVSTCIDAYRTLEQPYTSKRSGHSEGA